MKFVVQRVSNASVTVDQQVVGSIGQGFLVLVGISGEDTRDIADKMIKKLIGLRIFEDSEGKTNLALKDVSGQLLMISQFTLYADCKKGNRPSFINAGDPAHANELYTYIVAQCREQISVVETGIFGAEMKVSLCNDGPFTIILDSAMWNE
ncbi:MAG: D-tyrosyl-tRNA(Tyr) deacylase [Lachnospiraceae bacterium]|nr:D-tyrosyl-tRNA(Tyr) deacylase [Lachnospiraceae bacterium]MCI9149966.1 D-tyrosyl-tRNA(Tyr) deacylase [Lachnospiraceae bacterium]